ncbi:hypothetical protein K2173_013311 [Erythroxylum novogranatense]|uniref:Pentatricopeptide repeat-containing protein n=1 Tax=Erythroxylum novogranatense TaxID=1862640 RepID=A0AAV8S9X0_9ROSI|nr:hypothetical protein K2173_013311 [Erythroxylum novogranatense]
MGMVLGSKSLPLPFGVCELFVCRLAGDPPRLQLHRSSRTYCTQVTKKLDDVDEETPKTNVTKSSVKTKKAKSMARLINAMAWSPELESSLSSLAPSLSKTTVFQTLRLITRDPPKALRFFHWARRRGFTYDAHSYFMMLEILGRSRYLNIARNFLFSIEKYSDGAVRLEDKFFNSLIRSFGQAGLFKESLKLFGSMKSIGVSPSAVTFNSLLLILLKRGRTNMAKSVFDEMLNTYGVTPDAFTFNILIRGFCKNSMVDEGFWFFREMLRLHCEPDVITYNTLVDGLCREGKVRIARNLVNGMVGKTHSLSPNVVTYSTLVRGYCAKQEIDEALVAFQEMLDKGLKPNSVTCNTLIKGLCEAQKIDKVKEILQLALEGGEFAPDSCTFNTLIDAHGKAGNIYEALKVFEKMMEMKVRPDSATYSILIRNLCQKGEFERGEQLLDELFEKGIVLRADGCKPLVAAYKPMFEYLCKNGKTSKAGRVFGQLMRRGTQDPDSFKILIMGHCREGTFEAGYKLLVLMLRQDFEPDFETYYILIEGLLQQGEPVLACSTLEKMLKSSHLPETATFHSVLMGLLEKDCALESASFIELMLDRNIRQNLSLSTHTIQLLFDSGLRDKAFSVVGSLYDNGYVVDMKELVTHLSESKKLLEAQGMLLFCFGKHQKVDVSMCNSVIEGLCKTNRLKEAFDLYYEIVEKDKHRQLSCLEELKITLEAGGRLEEAKFVAKRMLN